MARDARQALAAVGRCSWRAASGARAPLPRRPAPAQHRAVDGEPTLFDAIEFDPDIATGDILYDLAFTLMDLWERGLRPAANLLLASYLSLSEEPQFLGLAACRSS